MTTELSGLKELIKDQASRTEKNIERSMASIQTLGEEIRDLTHAISKGLGRTKSENGSGNWQMLFGVAAIMFGLMTPLYMSVHSVSTEVQEMDTQMRVDDGREKGDAAKMATFTSDIKWLLNSVKKNEAFIQAFQGKRVILGKIE